MPEGGCVQLMSLTVLSTVCTAVCVEICVFRSQIFSFFSFQCDAMNRPLQVSFFFFLHVHLQDACIHTHPQTQEKQWRYKRKKHKTRTSKLCHWIRQTTGIKEAVIKQLDQSVTGGSEKINKKSQEPTVTVFMCRGSKTQSGVLVTQHLYDQMPSNVFC